MNEELKESIIPEGGKQQLVSLFVKKIMAWAVTKVAFLAGGPLAYIVAQILTKFVGYLLKEGIIGINHLIINLSVDGKVIPMEQARIEAVELLQKEGVTDEELDAIDAELIKQGSGLIKFGRKRL